MYWIKGGVAHYLLVSPKKGGDEWVLPKGHIEGGEEGAQAALREVREEAGVFARLICPLREIRFTTQTEQVTAEFYLMERISDGGASEPRKFGWFRLEEALRLATHAESKQLLQAAEDMLSTLLG